MTMTDIEQPLTQKQIGIVDAATRVFAEHGYRSGTVQMIAKEAGLSQAGLIHHFPTKESILMAVLQYRDADDREVSVPASEEGVSVVELYRRVLRKNAERSEMMRFFAVLSAEALALDHPAHEYFRKRFDDTASSTEALVARNQAAGIVRDDMPAGTIAELVISVAHGFRYSVLVGEDLDHYLRILGSLEQMLKPPG